MNTTLTEYTKAASEVSETWVGELCWYSMHDVAVPYDLFAKTLGGFPDLDIPDRPADHDVFRRACSKQKANRVPSSKPDEFFNYMMREFADDAYIIKRIIRETVNTKGKRLSYEPMIDVSFRRPVNGGEAGVRIKNIPDVTPDEMSLQLATDAMGEYRAKRGTLNAQGVREWMRRYLIEEGALCVRPSGGLYFIDRNRAGCLAILEVLTDAVNEDLGAGTIDYHSLPLIDTSRQKAMVKRAFEAETTGAIDSKMAEITALLKKGEKITEYRFSGVLGEYQRLSGRTKDYKAVLDTTLTDTESRLELFQAQVMELASMVDYGEA